MRAVRGPRGPVGQDRSLFARKACFLHDAAKLRPLSNVSRSGAKAVTASAVTGPILGMVRRRAAVHQSSRPPQRWLPGPRGRSAGKTRPSLFAYLPHSEASHRPPGPAAPRGRAIAQTGKLPFGHGRPYNLLLLLGCLASAQVCDVALQRRVRKQLNCFKESLPRIGGY